jgi:hypothetical protein
MWLYVRDVASLTGISLTAAICFGVASIRYGTGKIWHWPLLMILAVARLQILDDVSNLIQTRMRDRLRLTATGGLPTVPV